MKTLREYWRLWLLRWFGYDPKPEDMKKKTDELITLMIRERPMWTVRKLIDRFRSLYFWDWPRP